MTELLTAAQMKAIEKAAIDSGEVTGRELMERAGQGVVEAIFEEWPELDMTFARGAASATSKYLEEDERPDVQVRRAVVLCGPGNNGGDGFVVARLLHQRGWAVEVFLYGDAEKLPPDVRVNYERWLDLGLVGPIAQYKQRKTWACDLLIDALFGLGFSRPVPELAEVFWNMEDMVDCFEIQPGHDIGRPAIVAIDLISGLCYDSGKEFPHEESDYFRASAATHLTITFHAPKLGHLLGDGACKSGKLVTKDIGLSHIHKIGSASRAAIEHMAETKRIGRVVCHLVEPPLIPNLSKENGEHKFSHGHALILSGPSGKTGAARLAARGALRVGAGLVTLGVPKDATLEVASQITSIMMTEVDDAETLAAALADDRINALCIGPGLGIERARALVPIALNAPNRRVVLDADALTAFADDPAALFDMLHENCVLTPHGGEFARQFPDIAAQLDAQATKGPAYSKVDATRDAAKRAGCTVLFKGPDTVIASPSGVCAINAALRERSAPWLATAGSGDVLAGFITGLLARRLSPQSAAEAAAWLHVECARVFGPGLIAEDLPEVLPKVLQTLEAEFE